MAAARRRRGFGLGGGGGCDGDGDGLGDGGGCDGGGCESASASASAAAAAASASTASESAACIWWRSLCRNSSSPSQSSSRGDGRVSKQEDGTLPQLRLRGRSDVRVVSTDVHSAVMGLAGLG